MQQMDRLRALPWHRSCIYMELKEGFMYVDSAHLPPLSA